MRHATVLVSASLALVAACASTPNDGSTGAGSSAQAVGGELAARAHGRRWTALDVPTQAVITGGPWTLEQVGASVAAPSAGYCVGGVQQRNPGTERMQPYYFPLTIGRGAHLQGYFDYRPKDNDEAIVAATSDDFGHSWTFQQEALELSTACPASDAANNGGDDGQGHPFVMTVGGVARLYTLDRSAGNADSAGLVVHELTPSHAAPLAPAPAAADIPARTTGLLAPDGIFGVVPGSDTVTVLYLQKQLGGDVDFPASQQCAGKGANHDVTTLRLAQTTDGVTFTDIGPVTGLNDSTDVSPAGTRWVGPRGSILALANGRFGLFFSGGSCIDNDSDAFHYVGYAESSDLREWRVLNDMNRPIVSLVPTTATDASGASVTIPAVAPVAGTQGWFAGRVYGPSVTIVDEHTVTLTFAGYHTAKPKGSFGDYRNIGFVTLATGLEIVAGSGDADDSDN